MACSSGEQPDLLVRDQCVPTLLVRIPAWVLTVSSTVSIVIFVLGSAVTVMRGRAETHRRDLRTNLAFSVMCAFGMLPLGLIDLHEGHMGFDDGGQPPLKIATSVLVALGLSTAMSAAFPSLFFCDLLERMIMRIVGLNPPSEKVYYRSAIRVCTSLMIMGVPCLPAVLCLFLSTNGSVVTTAWVFLCWSLGVAALLVTWQLHKLTSLFLDEARLPPSAVAYLEEYPAEHKLIKFLMRTDRGIMVLGLSFACAVLVAPLVVPLWRFKGTFFFVVLSAISPGILFTAGIQLLLHWLNVFVAKPPVRSGTRSLQLSGRQSVRQLLNKRSSQWSSRASNRGMKEESSKFEMSSARQQTIREVLTAYDSSAPPSEKHQRGVSLAFLETFLGEFGIGADEATYEVCNRVVREHTREHQCCYQAMLRDGVDQASGAAWAATQTVFVSHSWGCKFRRIVETIRNFERMHGGGRGGRPHYYYLDVLCINQHDLAELTSKGEVAGRRRTASTDAIAAALLETLDRSIETAETVLVAIDRWDEPAPLSRIWCLFEIWRATHALDTPVRMGFPRDEAVRFAEAVYNLEADVDTLINRNVDVHQARATVERDLQMIQMKIEDSVGLDGFNRTLRTKLMAHFVRSVADARSEKLLSHRAKSAVRPRMISALSPVTPRGGRGQPKACLQNSSDTSDTVRVSVADEPTV